MLQQLVMQQFHGAPHTPMRHHDSQGSQSTLLLPKSRISIPSRSSGQNHPVSSGAKPKVLIAARREERKELSMLFTEPAMPILQGDRARALTPQQLFELLLLEFLQQSARKTAGERAPDSAKKDRPPSRTFPEFDGAGGEPFWKSWIPTGRYAGNARDGQYGAELEHAALDYGKLFSYLGNLRTAEGIYRDLYTMDEKELNRRFFNDAEALSERDIDREMLRDRNVRVGMGFLDYADPAVREKYQLYRLLLHEDTKRMRQGMVAV